jgi:hypothetical protein
MKVESGPMVHLTAIPRRAGIRRGVSELATYRPGAETVVLVFRTVD